VNFFLLLKHKEDGSRDFLFVVQFDGRFLTAIWIWANYYRLSYIDYTIALNWLEYLFVQKAVRRRSVLLTIADAQTYLNNHINISIYGSIR
jgi:hypothetical protein